MDTTTVKSEGSSVGHSTSMIREVDNAIVTKKSTKRRRRDHRVPAIVLPSSSNSEGNLQLLHHVAQSPTAAKRSSKFRGVSRHRWTGRFEAHLWDKGTWNPTQRKKGKQGAYDDEESAARAYDLAAIKYWGPSTFTNFPASDYEKEIELMKNITKEEYLATLRRRSSGFSRGVSKYRGVARHHHNGRWEARIGRVFGNKYLYLGTYSTQEEAAHAYDIAAIEYRGVNAVTNFDLSTYIRWLRPGGPAPTDPQDPILNTMENKPPQLLFNQFRTQQADMSQLNSLNYKPDDFTSPKRQDFSQTKFPSSSNSRINPSSPTALGLLLRSSVFRNLVQQNSTASEECPSHEALNSNTQQSNQMNEDDELGRILFQEVGTTNPFTFSSAETTLPDMTSPNSHSTPLYNPETQSLWTSTLNISPSTHYPS
uniref:AP2/ERF domain-containing protein n=1 Tax=Kalanchoe fedtschenkoi TaxID=63787 RepID=A0A7N0ZWT3_KALFE